MTVILRLYEKSAPSIEIDSRALHEGEMVIGRDQDADWQIPDPSRTLSRLHCVIAVKDGEVTVRDDSTNGVFLLDGERLPPKEATKVAFDETLCLGAFRISVEGKWAPAQPATIAQPPRTIPPLEDTPAGRLLDAFCKGAQIDSSVLSAEDPVEVMRRLGAVYREMVHGLGRLVDDRTRSKAGYGLEWTAVQAVDNNPFRWAPPQRVAVDLLQARQDGFLTADAAVRASFDDVQDHQVRLAAGTQGVVDNLLAELAPDAIAEGLQGQTTFMKKKTDVLWAEYRRLHARLYRDLGGKLGGQAFRDAYSDDGPESMAGE